MWRFNYLPVRNAADIRTSVLHTYIMSCHGHLSAVQKAAVSDYLSRTITGEGGEHGVAERWGLSTDEVRLFERIVEEQ